MLDVTGSEYKQRSRSCQVLCRETSEYSKVMDHEAWRQAYGNRLLQAIRRRGLTQREFAERVHVTEGAVSRWVNGESDTDLPLLPSFPKILGVTLDWLLGADAQQPADVPVVNARAVKRLIRALREAGAAGDEVAASLLAKSERAKGGGDGSR